MSTGDPIVEPRRSISDRLVTSLSQSSLDDLRVLPQNLDVLRPRFIRLFDDQVNKLTLIDLSRENDFLTNDQAKPLFNCQLGVEPQIFLE